MSGRSKFLACCLPLVLQITACNDPSDHPGSSGRNSAIGRDVSAPTSTSTAIDEATRDRVEALDQCRDRKAYDWAIFNDLSFPSDEGTCNVTRVGDLAIAKASFESKFGSLPYVVLWKVGVPSKSGQTLFLVGGPRDTVIGPWNSAFMKLLRTLASKSGTIVVPAYYGTAYRSVYPRQDIEVAEEELLYFLRDQGNYSAVVGGSAGALLGYKLSTRAALPALLISPTLPSISESYRIENADFIYGNFKQRSRSTSVLAYRLLTDRATPVGILTDRVEVLNRAFFGSFYDKGLYDRVREAHKRSDCIRFVFGARDGSSGLDEEKLAQLRRYHPVEVVREMGHVVADPSTRELLADQLNLLKSTRCD